MNCHYCKNATGMCDMCRQQRSNTAMTMPEKIWVWTGGRFWKGESHKVWSETSEGPDMDGAFGGEPYIRADLADELARALEVAMEMLANETIDGIRYPRAETALAQYKALTP